MRINKSLLRQTATIESDESNGDYGETSYSDVKTVKCRFLRKAKSVMGPDGTLQTIHAVIQTMPEDVITPEDRIVYEEVAYKVFDISEGRGGAGEIVCWTARLQQWAS